MSLVNNCLLLTRSPPTEVRERAIAAEAWASLPEAASDHLESDTLMRMKSTRVSLYIIVKERRCQRHQTSIAEY